MAIYKTELGEKVPMTMQRQDGERDTSQDPTVEGELDAESIALAEYQDHTTAATATNEAEALKERQGWELKKLGDACKVLHGKTVSGYQVDQTKNAIGREWGRRKQLERDNPEQALREAAERDEISERTGKPKKAPRGKPFQPGKDKRRLQDGAEGESEAGGEPGESGEGEGKPGEGVMPPETEPSGNPIEDLIRKIAREEDAKLAKAIDANFTAVVREIQAVKKIAVANRGGTGGGKVVQVTLESGEVREIGGLTHSLLPKILKKVSLFPNAMLVGPAGCGKTHIAAQVADALGYSKDEFAAVSCSIGMSESALTGRLLPTGAGGQFEYAIAEFVRLYENGGLFLLDEMDACDPNVLITINGAIANGRLPLPSRIHAPMAYRHARFKLVAAANTYGHGATRMYVGRNQLDATTTDRFIGAVVDMDYDRDLEAAMCDNKEWLRAFWTVRDKVAATQMRRIWSTRALIAGAVMLADGDSIRQVLQELTVGWTPDEKSKAGV